MTTKLKLTFGTPPSTFKKEVVATLLDGSQIKFEVDYVYRSRTQYAELMDELMGKSSYVEGEEFSIKSSTIASNKNDVETVLKIAKGWSLQDPFNEESLMLVEDSYPAVIIAIISAYRSAILEGRAKN
jgi:uncharacterized protein YfcZ (UPF0381/DUF406 family)